MHEETVEERQNGELEALKSIYGDDLEDLRSQTHGWQPLDIAIHLTPTMGSSGMQEINAHLRMRVTCSETYPNDIPQIKLEKVKGVSNQSISGLLEELNTQAKNGVGEVMIYNLAEHVKAFLHINNKPASRSFYDQMMMEQKEREALEIQAKQLQLDQTIQKNQHELEERKEMMRLERKKQRDKHLENSREAGLERRRSTWRNSSTEPNDDFTCSHISSETIKFTNNGDRVVLKGRCLSHSSRNCIIYSGLDQESGELFTISEWTIASENSQKVVGIEHELNYLVKLKHQNLGRYINVKHASKDGKMTIHILQEFIQGIDCSTLGLCSKGPLDIGLIRYMCEGVLSALEFLHRNNVLHKDLNEECVYLNNRGTVKLTSYSLDKRLSDLATQAPSVSRNKKTDIFKFGLLVLSLIKGSPVPEDQIPEIPTQGITQECYDFLSKCLMQEEKDRLTAPQLQNHQFLKISLRRNPVTKNAEDDLFKRNRSPEALTSIHMLAHSSSRSQCRLEKEFETLDHLGKGAYGNVIKVRNILDQRFYALKCIELNPRNKQLNKKIVREVKLLSSLNHENVVRYYNSWVEMVLYRGDERQAQVTSSCASASDVPDTESLANDSDIEKLAPPLRDGGWSVNYGNKSKIIEGSSSTDDESSEDEVQKEWRLSKSDSIQFEHSESPQKEDSPQEFPNVEPASRPKPISAPVEVQLMYIQMEFCEKSTLKTAIEDNLHADKERIWRLFREIVEGLAHIHQQGMIHRDLKPANIFLDSQDHVKIGDFGLATTTILAKQLENVGTSKSVNYESSAGDPSLTGYVGTALYIAPELTSSAKSVYNEKVDIYSLGVIFFEMSYPPLKTGMERIHVITRLRSEEINLPEDFSEVTTSDQQYIVKWLMNHDPLVRPTSRELLQSDYIPPPVLEEFELREVVRNTLSNTQSKCYKYLVESCFKQPVSVAQDITYDKDVSGTIVSRDVNLRNHIKDTVVKIFQIHGGQSLSTPLLMPKSRFYENVDTCVKLMTHSGSVVTLPHDLRVPFARYIAWNEITHLRRYSVDRVYKEKKVYGFSPRELYECNFDIVTPTVGSFMCDAELLYILSEIADALPDLKNKTLLLRINHSLLLKAICLHCGVKVKHDELFNSSEVKEGKLIAYLHSHLVRQGLSNNSIENLFNLLKAEGPLSKINSILQVITKKHNEASKYAVQGLKELEKIITNAEAFGVSFNIVVSLGVIHNVHHYSGMMCQLVCEVRKKHKNTVEVLATGGRYDNMIAFYRDQLSQANLQGKEIKQTGAGFSLQVEKVMQAMHKDPGNDSRRDISSKLVDLDVVLCSLGGNALHKDSLKVLKDLWSAGIKSGFVEGTSIEDILEQCRELNVPHTILLKSSERGAAKIRSWEKERFVEKKCCLGDLVETMQRVIRSWSEGGSDPCNLSNSLSKSESKAMAFADNQEVNVMISFVAEKISASIRRRTENQIRSQLDSMFKKLNGDVWLLAISLKTEVVLTMASLLNLESEEQFYKSTKLIIEKHPRHKKTLQYIFNEIYEKHSEKSRPVIVLYSLDDSMYKVLL